MRFEFAILCFIFKVTSVTLDVTDKSDPNNKNKLLPRLADKTSFETAGINPNSYPRVRKKRVIYAQSITRYDHPIVEYQAAIFPGQFCDNDEFRLKGLDPRTFGTTKGWSYEAQHQFYMEKFCTVKKSMPHCSGTAITRNIVQTACHCVARPVYKQAPDRDYRGFVQLKVLNDFEDLTLVKIGVLRYDNVTFTNMARWFIAHPKCADSYGYITYDFGLIWLKFPNAIRPPPPSPPPYSDLAQQQQYIESHELVCMIVGWGATDLLMKNGSIYYGSSAVNVKLGWHVLVNKYECYLAQSEEYNFQLAFPNTTYYKAKSSWMCHKPFGRRRSLITAGDAGGPMVCMDNRYYAIQQWHRQNTPFGIQDRLSTSPIELNGAGPLIYFPGPNTADLINNYIANLKKMIPVETKRRHYSKIVPDTKIDEIRTNDASKSFRFEWLLILSTILFNY